jgi:hypothetical protein
MEKAIGKEKFNNSLSSTENKEIEPKISCQNILNITIHQNGKQGRRYDKRRRKSRKRIRRRRKERRRRTRKERRRERLAYY